MTPLQAILLGRQHARILLLSFPNDNGPASELVVEQLQAFESLSKDFLYKVELLSDNANIDLEEVQGKLMCVSLVRADGTLRHFTGHVWSFRHLKTNGGVATYEAELVPWFHFLKLRENCRPFHNQTLQQQIEALFADYGALPRWEWKVTGEQRQFTMCIQWSESDHNYVSARLEAAGYPYGWEHTEDGHTWIVKSDTRDCEPIDGASPNIRFHSNAGSEEENAIAQWRPCRQAVSSTAVLSGYDFKAPDPVHVDTPTVNTQGEVPKLEVHSYEGHYGFTHRLDGERLARLRMEEIEARDRQYEAEGNCGFVMPGRWFQLVDHHAHRGEDAQFLILEATHYARNNYLQGDDAVAEYRNTFKAQRKAIPWKPGRQFNSTRTQVLAPQTATVVGPEENGAVNVDEYGRIQVQFHWDRGQTMSCRVRVATNWAGGENGLLSHPRVGSEVVIQFLDGNPDHPIITGGIFNQRYMPPWKLPEQHVLTGLRSRELTPSGGNNPGGRSNHVILDDTHDDIQVQVKSDHLCSQLSLGDIRRIEDTAGRKDARGQGAELHTEGHAVLRAGKGMLVTTELRQNARGHITDMPETIERLTQGEQLHDSLSKVAQEAQAHQSGDQDEVVKSLQAQNTDIKGSGGNPEQGEFPEFQAPHLTFASPAGIQTTTEGSTHIASAQHTALSSGGHTSISSGKSLLAAVKDAIRLFAYKTGMKLVAATANIDITALKDSINLLAKLNITHTANRIEITAKQEVVINGGGSYTKWTGSGISHGTSGPWQVKAASFSHSGPASMGTPSLPQAIQLPKGNLELFHEYVLSSGERIQGVKQGQFSVVDSEGASHGGALDGNGFNAVASVPMGMAEIDYGKDPSDPWDEGSHFGKTTWPPMPPATGASSAMSALGSSFAGSQAGKAGSGNSGALGALGGVAGVASLAGAIPGASSAAAGLGKFAAVASTAQQAVSTVQAVQQGGAQALLQPALQIAKSKAMPVVAQQAKGALPPGFAGDLSGGMPSMPTLAKAKPAPSPLEDYREFAV